MGPTAGSGTCTTPVKGADWLGDQDAIEYLCRHAPDAVYELEHYGVPFSRTGRRHIYQRPFRRHDDRLRTRAPGAAHLRGGRSHRPRHLHTLYGQALRHAAQFLRGIFRHRPDHRPGRRLRRHHRAVPGGRTLHRIRAQKTILATGGYGRTTSPATSAHTCTGDGNAKVLRAGLPLQDMEFVQFHPTGVYGAGVLITEAHAGRAAT